MSDYLNNLAARTLELAPLIKPRTASLFEPVSLAHNASHASLQSEPELRESNLEVNEGSRVTSQNHTIRHVTRGSTRREHYEFNSEAGETDVIEGSVQTLVPQPTVRSSVPRSYTENNSSADAFTRDLASIRWLRAQIHEPHDAPAISPATTAGGDNDSETSARFVPTIRRVSAHLDQTEHRGANKRGTIHPLNTLARRTIVDSKIQGEAPPTIKVTIGRVDVRAVFSQPPATKASRDIRPAAMSLNEYLKQRNEGRR